MRLIPHTLKFKVGLYMAVTLTLAMTLFTLFVVAHQRDELRDAMVVNLAKISEIIIKSTSYAMLKNEPVYVKQIIKDVGKQENIAKVRIWTKDGTIIYSSYSPEVGKNSIGVRTDACSVNPLTPRHCIGVGDVSETNGINGRKSRPSKISKIGHDQQGCPMLRFRDCHRYFQGLDRKVGPFSFGLCAKNVII